MELVCVICATPLPTRLDRGGGVVFPCNHVHCLACVRRNYTVSAGAGSAGGNNDGGDDVIDDYYHHYSGEATAAVGGPFRPVQCCPGSRLPVPTLRRALGLGSAEVARYRSRLAEHDAPSKLYCHDPRCGRFIPELLRDARSGRCRACHARTCVRCGGRAHTGATAQFECDDFWGLGVGGAGGRGGAFDKKNKKRKEEEEAEEKFKMVAKEMGW
ncbi:hypothetical protein VTH82DRAFT_2644 [Thermothelomyces myriococcoides]